MMRYKRHRFPALVFFLYLSVIFSNSLYAHGLVVNSRAHSCSIDPELNSNCGVVSGLPQYVLGDGRFPESGPIDGKLASAEIVDFAELDVQNDSRWYKHNITTGAIEFIWGISISHPTTEFNYYITKPNWNPNTLLTRNSFNLIPFCSVPVNQDVIPNVAFHHCTIPLDYSGYHVIYATWDTTSESLGFYQVMDVNISEAIENIFQNGFEIE